MRTLGDRLDDIFVHSPIISSWSATISWRPRYRRSFCSGVNLSSDSCDSAWTIKADAWKAPSNQCCVCLMLTYFSFNQCVDTWSNDFELARQMCTNPEEQTVGTVDASDCHHSRPDWSHEYEFEKWWPSDVEGKTVGRIKLKNLTDILNFWKVQNFW